MKPYSDCSKVTPFRRGSVFILPILAVLILTGGMTACSTGGGGDTAGGGGDGASAGDVNGPGSSAQLAFSYPLNGQDDVYTKTQVAVGFRGNVGSDPGLTLVANGGPVATDVTRDANQPNIFRLSAAGDADSVERSALAPNTDYSVQNSDGDTLFTFTTRGFGGRPDTGAFSVRQLTAIGDRNVPFTTFNPIRAQFSRPVDEGSVELCTGNEALGDNGCTIAVTGPDGNVPGRLTVLGSNMTFDPSSDLGDGTPNSRDADDYNSSDLVAGQTYTVAFNGVQSAFGDSLNSSFSVTPVSTGNDVVQGLTISGGSQADNPLNGSTRNVANIVSQLIGVNNQAASNTPERGGLLTRLAEPSNSSRYNGTFPALLPAGQEFDLEPINLQLGGAIDTPVNTGPIHARIINDADVYIAGNTPLAGIETPTLVLLRLDLGISTDVSQGDPIESLSNGVFNQTVLNVVAAGEAVPQPNGDVKLTTLGSFPASVNRDGQAITDFELELTLPNPLASGTITVDNDQTPPRIIAQYPSACEYTFGLTNFNDAYDNDLNPISLPEPQCGSVLSEAMFTFPGAFEAYRDFENGGTADVPPYDDEDDFLDAAAMNMPVAPQEPYIDGFPPQAKPSLTFSEPVDPSSLRASITLSQLSDTGSSTEVPIHSRAEGSSVVLEPESDLLPDTRYRIDIGSGITDLSGNGLVLGGIPTPVIFRTQPIAAGDEDIVRQTAPFITAIAPGLPCTLVDGNFMDDGGGDTAGRCFADQGTPLTEISDDADTASPRVIYDVFDHPVNAPIGVVFSKEVQASTITNANGCLIGGGDDNTVTDASFAVQIMDGNDCVGVAPGDIALGGVREDANGNRLTESFTFKPRGQLDVGQRYWMVLCGGVDRDLPTDNGNLPTPANQPTNCVSGATILGRDGYRLNTDPLFGTGTRQVPAGAADRIFADERGEGGDDLVIPFDGASSTADYNSIASAAPISDTNGNGFFDGPQIPTIDPPPVILPGLVTSADARRDTPFDDSLGQEIPRPQNRLISQNIQAFPTPTLPLPDIPSQANDAYLSGSVPISVRAADVGARCAPVKDVEINGQSVVGDASNCIPVSIMPGALLSITDFNAGETTIVGRTLLRFPDQIDTEGSDTGNPQNGYIVPECQGQIDDESFDYSPCFVADLTVTVNLPSLANKPAAQILIPQQDVNVQLVGPVSFQQNGRLTIATTNTNQFEIRGDAINGLALFRQIVRPGQQTLQLVGPAIHGGKNFSVR